MIVCDTKRQLRGRQEFGSSGYAGAGKEYKIIAKILLHNKQCQKPQSFIRTNIHFSYSLVCGLVEL